MATSVLRVLQSVEQEWQIARSGTMAIDVCMITLGIEPQARQFTLTPALYAQVISAQKTPQRDGTKHVILQPLNFIVWPATLVARMKPAGSNRISCRKCAWTLSKKEWRSVLICLLGSLLGKKDLECCEYERTDRRVVVVAYHEHGNTLLRCDGQERAKPIVVATVGSNL